MRLLATGLILILAGVLAAQDAPKKKKKVRPPFKWVNKLSANVPKEVRHATFRSPLMGVEVGYCIYLPAQYEAAKTKRFPVVALVGCREVEQEAAPIQQAHAEDVHTYEDSKEAHAATEAKSAPVNIADPIVEKVIRAQLKKPTGELTQADLEKVPGLSLESHQLTDVKDLEKLPQLKALDLSSNKLTSVNGLEKLTQLTMLNLEDNPDLTKAQIAGLKKALPKCNIFSNPKK